MHDLELKELVCRSCGGNMEIDHENNIVFCPYCGAKDLIIDRGKVLFKNNEVQQKRVESPKKKRKQIKPLLVVLLTVVVLIVLLIIIGGASTHRAKHTPYDWPDSGVATILPQPEPEYGEVYYISNDSFSMELFECTQNQFLNYIEACQKAGFTIDEESGNTSYEAFNEEGYSLRLYYYSTEEEMSISLYAPVELTTIYWEYIDGFALLPEPESDQGKVEWEYTDSTSVYIGDTTKEEYDAYVRACKDAGFNRNMLKGDKYYYAYYKDSDQHLMLTYEGFNVMRIDISVYEN